ncbi:hypothetical protein [Paenibacillus beijingensis]|uniref:hypothetical protein n=1 Tax=Paenibacillus beijingensis TaxID=1126833 RepID=UPI0006967488|nr:hypothetical protein [Paenibacillus beijingensis]
MIQHMFTAMNDMLSGIISRYPGANEEHKRELCEQLAMLRSMSDNFIECWLELEEKMADFRDAYPETAAAIGAALTPAELAEAGTVQAAAAPSAKGAAVSAEVPHQAEAAKGAPKKQDKAEPAVLFASSSQIAEYVAKGQGFFKLFMFRQAADQFQQAVHESPECNLARLFLAMSLMHLQQWGDAERHFRLLVELTEHPKWRALGLNALGCIQAIRLNLEYAEHYFLKAHQTDPSFTDPLNNLKSCKETPGQLSLYFGSAELTCL